MEASSELCWMKLVSNISLLFLPGAVGVYSSNISHKLERKKKGNISHHNHAILI
jgi:putative effector of murein hydrolase LrgA (UPF0299 family)